MTFNESSVSLFGKPVRTRHASAAQPAREAADRRRRPFARLAVAADPRSGLHRAGVDPWHRRASAQRGLAAGLGLCLGGVLLVWFSLGRRHRGTQTLAWRSRERSWN